MELLYLGLLSHITNYFDNEIHNIVCKQSNAYIVSKFIKSNFYKYEKHLNYNFCVFKGLRCSYVSLLVTV